jgi:4-amino-4-deoxy-L-arabinose transferase-like glycosyltransferase
MLIKDAGEKIFAKQDLHNVLILTLITLCLGVFLIATTVVIAKDGTVFVEYAKKIPMSPSQTMLQEYQHPGYPVLILAASKATDLFYKGGQLFRFIYAAQATALLFRILAIIVLYFFGKELVGARYAFRAVLILILLPKPAEYGSDALSDWPHLFFLALGMLMLFYGAKFGKWWLFTLAGLAGGLAYLIRPEGAQVVIYGLWWLGLQLFWKKRTLRKSHAVLGLVSMLFIFIIIVSPYMKLKGAVFPKKGVGEFSSMGIPSTLFRTGLPAHSQAGLRRAQSSRSLRYDAIIVPSQVGGAIFTIFENAGDTLMWFFLVPYFIGIFLHFKEHKLLEYRQFFILALVVINVPLMIWLYCSHGYMSVRHTLPLVVFTMFFIPTGLQSWASWLNIKFSKGYQHTHRWFAILMVTGIVICTPKLLRSLHPDKVAYRQASRWLADNTEKEALIAVPDYRISLYAQRESFKMADENVPQSADYLVEINDMKDNKEELKKVPNFLKVHSIKDNRDKKEIVIYKRINQ